MRRKQHRGKISEDGRERTQAPLVAKGMKPLELEIEGMKEKGSHGKQNPDEGGE